MGYYNAHNVALRSDLSLPELVASERGEDVMIRYGSVGVVRTGGYGSSIRSHIDTGEIRLFQDGIGAFLVKGGEEIVVDPIPGIDDQLLRSFLLGPVLAVLLHQRDRLVLHASGVEMGGRGVLFMGGPESGKSTLAAAMLARGHALIGDDILAVESVGEGMMVSSSFPQIRLRPDSALALGHRPQRLPQVRCGVPKRSLRAERFTRDRLPIGAIYLLTRESVYSSEPLDRDIALAAILDHAYAINLLSETTITPEHVRHCALLARTVPVRRLNLRSDFTGIEELARRVEGDHEPGIQTRSRVALA